MTVHFMNVLIQYKDRCASLENLEEGRKILQGRIALKNFFKLTCIPHNGFMTKHFVISTLTPMLVLRENNLENLVGEGTSSCRE